MCEVKLNECTCSCHYMEGVVHMVPCCEGGLLPIFGRGFEAAVEEQRRANELERLLYERLQQEFDRDV